MTTNLNDIKIYWKVLIFCLVINAPTWIPWGALLCSTSKSALNLDWVIAMNAYAISFGFGFWLMVSWIFKTEKTFWIFTLIRFLDVPSNFAIVYDNIILNSIIGSIKFILNLIVLDLVLDHYFDINKKIKSGMDYVVYKFR